MTDETRTVHAPERSGAETVLVLHERPQPLVDQLSRRFPENRFVSADNYADVQKVIAAARPDVVLAYKISGQGAFPAEMLHEGSPVRWLHAGGAGIDHLTPWDPARVVVTNSSGIHGRPLAMLVTWAVLNQALRMPMYAAEQRAHRWLKHELTLPLGEVVAIVGFGRIGADIGRHLRSFGFHVLGIRRSPEASPDADEVMGLDQLRPALGRADHVVLVMPLTAESRNLFDAEMLAAMKPGAHIINIARGGIIDEQALRENLVSGKIGSATLDVFETEPLPAESPLWDAPNMVITPHGISDIVGWEDAVLDIFKENLERWREGRALRNLCDPGRGY
jgi:phosphoglycerate dehydrogenase-like enzyme